METADSRNKLHSHLRLWEFPDQYIIEPADGSGASCLDISRVDASMKLIDHVPESNSVRVPKIRSIFGVVGMLKLLAGSYLVVVTESERVGSFLGHPIFKITTLKVLPCDHSLQNSPEEQKKMETEFSKLLSVAEKTTGLYFSYEVNLTLSSQRLHDLGDESKSLPLWRQAEPRFLWNNYMLEVLIDNKLDQFLLPVIQGSFNSFETAIGRDIVDITLIARRCTRRNGTRMWRRGADLDGYVANFVETEQIVQMNGYSSSFVQVRGSIPFMWEQVVDLTYKPKFEIVQPEEATRIAERHFLDLRKKYGSVLAVDLVNKHGGEGRLSEKYATVMQHITGDDIRYLHFDFHQICGHIHFERLSILYEQIEGFLEKNGYFLLNEKGEKMKDQLGVVRSNCIDCLDRTNVTQSMIGRKMLELQLKRIGVFGAEETISSHPNFDEHYKILWANHGDEISIQYSGTPALKGDFVRYGHRTAHGVLKDGWSSLRRYYLNNFADGTKQDAIDLLQGHYIVAVSRDMAPVPQKGGLEAVANFPVALFVVLMSFWFATMSLKQAGSDYKHKHLFFSLLWTGICVGMAALVRANGRIFCNRPRLHKPRG
ncbi:SAC domain [Arabidopsis thaliana x Arabidopsis arenosa]|uniref:SAC domain n=1 Tax=Arabidopsis thaliana x Arabidopsis arenosa TaxID=1240361 RepID=A0A8T1ZM28_9BRAS|nr:SAC domain [Arabidopsis thaliana x Arabidopsis arenosa]